MNVKEAANVALEYFKDLFGDYDYTDIRLEEVSKSQGGWEITLGYLDRNQEGFGLGLRERKYKIFTVSSSSGEVTSMKIRKVE